MTFQLVTISPRVPSVLRALLVAERGVVFFRDQELDVHQQLDLARYWGPLHKHSSTPIPRDPGLEEVHGNHVVRNHTLWKPESRFSSRLQRCLSEAGPS